jgi:K+/H+ antiporter YhaU regulatory subunit KhtT
VNPDQHSGRFSKTAVAPSLDDGPGCCAHEQRQPAPDRFAGKSLIELNLREKFGLNVLAIKREGKTDVSPPPTELIRPKDILLLLGSRERAEKCFKE